MHKLDQEKGEFQLFIVERLLRYTVRSRSKAYCNRLSSSAKRNI